MSPSIAKRLGGLPGVNRTVNPCYTNTQVSPLDDLEFAGRPNRLTSRPPRDPTAELDWAVFELLPPSLSTSTNPERRQRSPRKTLNDEPRMRILASQPGAGGNLVRIHHFPLGSGTSNTQLSVLLAGREDQEDLNPGLHPL